MTGQITLQHSSVNSNIAVTLPSAAVQYTWGALSNTTPIPGKWDIAETDVGGFENPKIVIRGTMDIGDIPTNSLTQSLLMDFAQILFTGSSATAIKLTIASGGDGLTDVYLKGRPSAGYSIGGTYLAYLYVTIDGFSISFDSNIRNERKWDYQITFTETKVT